MSPSREPPDAIPTAWGWATAEEVTSAPIIYGILQPGPVTPGGVPYVRPTEIVGDVIALDQIRTTTKAIAGRYARSTLRAGDVLISIVGTIGKVAIVPPELEGGNITQSSARLRPAPGLLVSKTLAWLLRSPLLQRQYDRHRLGTGVPRLNIAHVRDLRLPLAPLNEQRRIVAKIEDLTARSRRAREALERIPSLLERFRRSVLAAAFRGDLTAEWRHQHPDVEPASAVLQRLRQAGTLDTARVPAKWKKAQARSEGSEWSWESPLPNGWCWVTLGDAVARLTNGYVGPTRGIYEDEGIPYLLSKHVHRNTLRFDGDTFISREFNEKNTKSILKRGDVLLVQTGHVGESAVVPPEHEGHNCHAMIVISPAGQCLDGYFLSLLFESPAVQSAFASIEKGMTLRHLNCHDVIKIRVPLPPLPEQREVVRLIHERLAFTDRVSGLMAQAGANFDALDQSILAKAFRGELVPQDPNDEPANVLLERVRAEREGGTTPTDAARTGKRRAAKGAR